MKRSYEPGRDGTNLTDFRYETGIRGMRRDELGRASGGF